METTQHRFHDINLPTIITYRAYAYYQQWLSRLQQINQTFTAPKPNGDPGEEAPLPPDLPDLDVNRLQPVKIPREITLSLIYSLAPSAGRSPLADGPTSSAAHLLVSRAKRATGR